MLFKVNLSLMFLIVGACASNSSLNDSIRGLDNDENDDRVVTWSMVTEEFKRLVDSFLAEDLRNVYEISEKINISSRCNGSLIKTVYAFQNMTEWALRLVDASGKLPGGILEGTMLDFGSYSECLEIRVKDFAEDKESFRGRYCMVGYNSPLLKSPKEKTPSGMNYIDAYGVPPSWARAFMDAAGPVIAESGFWFGTCVPSSCSEEDVKEIFTFVVKPFGLSVNVAGCQVDDEPIVWSVSTIIAVVILCFLLCMCLLGTSLDVILRYQVKKSQHFEADYVLFRVFLAFSVYTNTEKLLADSNGRNNLSCFHGMRFLSALWVILSHTYYYGVPWRSVQYRDEVSIFHLYDSVLSAVLDNFTVEVETFFFISGFLLVHVTWKKLENSDGKLNPLMFVVSKYWRLAPSLGLLMLLLFVLPLIGSGPLWKSTLDVMVGVCEDNWWTNFLFINNFWIEEKQCLIHTWFLAALMQLNIIGILILLLAFRWPLVSILLGTFIGVSSSVAVAVIVILYDFPIDTAAIKKYYDLPYNIVEKIYFPFCGHLPTYLIGMALAFLFMKYKDKQIGMGYQKVGWLLAVLGALSSLYGIHAPMEKVAARAFFTSCFTIGWSLSIAWLTFACITGRGGIVNRFLSWNAFMTLSQLSFLAYLLHPLVIFYRVSTITERMTYSHIDLVFLFLAIIVIAFFLAYIGYVSVEKPFQILERMLFQNRSDNLKRTANAEESELACHNKISA